MKENKIQERINKRIKERNEQKMTGRKATEEEWLKLRKKLETDENYKQKKYKKERMNKLMKRRNKQRI